MRLYKGMLGYVAFVRSDRMVSAHIHCSGEAPPRALKLEQGAARHTIRTDICEAHVEN